MELLKLLVGLMAGLFGAGGTIIWWGFRRAAIRLDEKIDKLIEVTTMQRDQIIRQSGEVVNLTKRVDNHDDLLKEHEVRIRKVEQNQVACKNYNK